MAIQWWRSWHGAPTDHKWQVIAAKAGVKVGVVSAVAWALMDYASQHKDRGSIAGFDAETYAVYSGFDEQEVLAVIKALDDKGVISGGRFVKWEERQPKREDDSAERVRQHRQLKRNVTHCNAENADETFSSSSLSLSVSDSDSYYLKLKDEEEKFDFVQSFLEKLGILVQTPGDIKALNSMINSGAIPSDIHNGLSWLIENKKKSGAVYAPSLVGPTETARLMRLQVKPNGSRPTKEPTFTEEY